MEHLPTVGKPRMQSLELGQDVFMYLRITEWMCELLEGVLESQETVQFSKGTLQRGSPLGLPAVGETHRNAEQRGTFAVRWRHLGTEVGSLMVTARPSVTTRQSTLESDQRLAKW